MSSHRPTDAALAHIARDPNVQHVPAWLYVQNQGEGTISFVGSSRVTDGQPHPLRYGSNRTHQLIVGELLVRPHYVLGTDVLQGQGLGGLATAAHGHPDTLAHYLDQGELILDPYQLFPRASL